MKPLHAQTEASKVYDEVKFQTNKEDIEAALETGAHMHT